MAAKKASIKSSKNSPQKSSKPASQKAAKKGSKKSAKKQKGPVAPAALVEEIQASVAKYSWTGSIVAKPLAMAAIKCKPGERPVEISFMRNGKRVTRRVCVPI